PRKILDEALVLPQLHNVGNKAHGEPLGSTAVVRFYHVTQAGVTLWPQQLRKPPSCQTPSSSDSRRAGQLRRPKRTPRSIPHRNSSTGSSAGPSPPSARETSASTAPNPSEIGRARSTRSKFWSSTAGSSPTKRAGATCTNGKLFEGP